MDESYLPGSTESLRFSTQNVPIKPGTQVDDATESSFQEVPMMKESSKFDKLKQLGSKVSLGRNKVEPFDCEMRPSSAPIPSNVVEPFMFMRPKTAIDASMRPMHVETMRIDENTSRSLAKVDETSFGTNDTSSRIYQKEMPSETPYIPYEYAHAMISRIVDDMKEMKLNHLSVVAKIESQYQSIENETQVQFEAFLHKLQAKNQSKIKSLLHVIDVLKGKLESSNETIDIIESLKMRNKQLLHDKASMLKAQKQVVQEADTKGKGRRIEPEEEEKIQGDLFENEKKQMSFPEEPSEKVENFLVEEVDFQRSKSPVEASSPPKSQMPDKDLNPPAELQDDIGENIDDITQKREDADLDSSSDVIESFPETQGDLAEEYVEQEIEENGEESATEISDLIIGGAVIAKQSPTARNVQVTPENRPQTREKRGADMQAQKTRAMLVKLKKQNEEYSKQIQALERQLKSASGTTDNTPHTDKEKKRMEKKIKDLEKKLENEIHKLDKNKSIVTELQNKLQVSAKEFTEIKKSLTIQEQECAALRESVGAGAIALQQVPELQKEVKDLLNQNKTLTENYNSERNLRKKYYNMVEDMKGKIRVYCRVRPLSSTEKQNNNRNVVFSPDDYTVKVEQARGDMKEFQFDQIFTEDNSQEDVFENTYSLVQSAVDGYNVCVFAYGQTGSGKTYTMIGDKEQKTPGLAPRAFTRIFELVENNKQKFKFKISCYMLELYNEKLVDLLCKNQKADVKLEVKKDNKGMVFVQGCTVENAESANELYQIFLQGSESRHTASTKMNSESSRSHLIIGVIMESTNLATGAVIRGKLSLVDLAGSERVGKTGATATQLKEANSINKSLSALGDVISALSSEQAFIPYRNNKLTMLMQDSLGGNAKTLMFVNISPADYNSAESIISLTYAARVKLITNDASKNAESREVVRLKQIIAKLRAGESIDNVEE